MKNLFKFKQIFLWLMVGIIAIGPLVYRTASAEDEDLKAEDKDLKEAFEPCKKAAIIGTQYGALKDFDPDWQRLLKDSGVLQKTDDFLRDEFKKTGINLDDIKKGLGLDNVNIIDLSSAKNFIKTGFSSLFENKYGKGIQVKSQGIIEGATDKLLEIAGIKEYKDILENSKDILGGLLSTDVPVSDAGTVAKIEESKQAQIAEQTRQQIIATTRAQCNDLLRTTTEEIKRTLLYQLSTQIVDWIQTGEKPQFIKQPGKFLEDTGRLAVDRFISRVAPRLCEPFRLAVQINIPSMQREANPFYEQVTCTLDQMGRNLESFYQDFRSGGWVTYNEVLKPQNNYIGTSIAVSDEALRQQQAAIDEAKQAQDRGFTSQKECTQWMKYIAEGAERGHTLTDYRVSVIGVGEFVSASNQTPETQKGSGPVNADGTVVSGFNKDPQTGPVEKGTRFWKQNLPPDQIYFWECMADKITNPATIAAGLSERASQTELDYLANTTDIENFLGTIGDAIINKLVKSGVKGLRNILPKILP